MPFIRSRIPELAEKEIALKIIAYDVKKIIILNNSIFIFVIFRFSTELHKPKNFKFLLCSLTYAYF